jgi:GNAT superfamily N-acetyltransferase
MNDLTVEQATDVPLDELLDLYGSVGWTAYTAEPDVLRAAVAGSSFVVTARRGGRLVGLARAVSDGATICYLQDILVRPDEHRTGVGRALATAVLDRYADVRQKVLLTDDDPRPARVLREPRLRGDPRSRRRNAARVRPVRRDVIRTTMVWIGPRWSIRD